MSMEIHVLFRGKLPTKAALTRAMKEVGFPLSIAPPGGSLEQHKGFMPMRLKREETGVEFDVFDGRAVVEEIAGERSGHVDPSFDRSANFRWGGDENEMLCALCGAAALAKLVNGMVLDEEEGKLLSPDEAIGYARQHLVPLLAQAQQEKKDKTPGTRPADIKRYLKPLLELRSDLALVGRMLVVRPARHVLRGALFGRTSDKHQFRLWRYIKPLYYGHLAEPGFGGHSHAGGHLDVWQPHLQPFLMDVLAEDIFDDIGRMTIFMDMVGDPGEMETSFSVDARIVGLLLAGERERAIELVRKHFPERSDNPFSKTLWGFVDMDVEDLCANRHAREADMAKALKIEHIWEPSPFPVELPAAEPESVAEPIFRPTPWITRPSWLLGEVPQAPGEVRFAKDTITRNDRLILLVPLSADEAEQRHRDSETYTLVARLPNGLLLLLKRFGWDRNQPLRFWQTSDSRSRVSVSLIVNLYGLYGKAYAWTSDPGQDDNACYLTSIGVYERDSRWEKWSCSVSLEEGTRRVRDSRSGERIQTKAALTDVERDLFRCSNPSFGEYAEVADRLQQILQGFEYGELR